MTFLCKGRILSLLFVSCFLFNQACANESSLSGPKLYERYPHAILYYYGITGSDALGRILLSATFHRWPEHVQSVEYIYTPDPQNPVREFFSPFINLVQIAGNFTYRHDEGSHKIYEFDPYLIFRVADFSWNDTLNTSFAVGEGVSYTTRIPSLESHGHRNAKRFLNYLMLEASFALPKYPRLQMVLRVHHRSGAYGLYHAGNTGSNAIGLGVRYLF